MKKKSKILKKVKLHCEKKAKEARKIVHYKAKPKERDAEVLEDAQVAAMEARRAKAIENYEQNQTAKRERVCPAVCPRLSALPWPTLLYH